jgi:3-dehydroquinate synthase
MEILHIDLGSHSYTIHIDSGLLTNLPSYLGSAEAWVVITDEVVDGLYGQELVENWNHNRVHKIVLPAGEETKNLQTVEEILRKMLNFGVTRRSRVLALGGGVVGDLAGFCASIYMRGISYIQVPTTLLAQVDSSVGGKTGVNLPQGKNLVGSFYQPQGVFIDIKTLGTLPRRHLISGMAEVIKYGIIYDYAFLGYLHRHFEDILSLEEKSIKKVITRCCEIKAQVVAEDEKEEGIRKILNYGHTIGHALEIATEYQHYTHGEAVLKGMYVEALMARELGLIDPAYYNEISALIQETGVGLNLDELLHKNLINSMQKDKKNRGGNISFVLPCNKGETAEVLMTKEEVSHLLQKL